jgi:intein-encoded DNA endonuclease-like protein
MFFIQGVPLATEPGVEDIATKFEQEYVRCVRNEEECVCSAPNCCDTEQRSASKG